MKKPELLVPVGDFECLKAAVQNGADAVYLGIDHFNARYGAKNFTLDTLQDAIDYAHLRHVQVHLTLNILIKDKEWQEAIAIVKRVYEMGIDAIIVQDLGLATYIITHFPDLPVHASTQMTCHNLEGAVYLQQLGVKRIVLSRELSLSEIAYIKSNLTAEVEIFGHGALCICYSGQCLYSSLIGGRSGNRGKCAQGCRLPYQLLEDSTCIDEGYLLSPRDLCSLEMLPSVLQTNIDSLKIEGRMKSPEYVAIVTKMYRKYIDMATHPEDYHVDAQDIHDLLQVFNRGEFSTGHLKTAPNKDLIFQEKPNHMGICIGQVDQYHAKQGHIVFHSQDALGIGDTISFEKEPTRYTISELMMHGKNIREAHPHDIVEIGRMKGNISVGDKIYKLTSKQLTEAATHSYDHENIKTALYAVLDVHLDAPITLRVFDENGVEFTVASKETPDVALNAPITRERLERQLNKTTNTPFYFKDIKIYLDPHVYIAHISTINELRRNALEQYARMICDGYRRMASSTNDFVESSMEAVSPTTPANENPTPKISVLLNILQLDFDYTQLTGIDALYLPLKYFSDTQYEHTIALLTNHFATYIYMPSIMRGNYKNLFKNCIDTCLEKYNIKGFVVSNVGDFELLQEYREKYDFVANYTLNVFNEHTLATLPTDTITLSPESNQDELAFLAKNASSTTELLVYGNLPLMTMQYCLLGKSNKCYPECAQRCKGQHRYYLKDRMTFKFRVLPDNIQTTTTLYNSKTTSIVPTGIGVSSVRLDMLDESIEEMQHIIDIVKSGQRLEGQDYTNGNLHRDV